MKAKVKANGISEPELVDTGVSEVSCAEIDCFMSKMSRMEKENSIVMEFYWMKRHGLIRGLAIAKKGLLHT